MKATLIPVLLASLLVSFSVAAPKGKGRAAKERAEEKKKEEQKANAADESSPAKALAPFIEKVDLVLALRPPAGPAPLWNQAHGKVAVLKQQFTVSRTGAEGADAAKYDAAIATCTALLGAIDERDRTASAIFAASAVHGSEKINAPPRKDAANQGVRGGDLSKAVGEVVEAQRERDEKQAGHQATVDTDNALTAAAIKRWKQREIELRAQITAAYVKIGA